MNYQEYESNELINRDRNMLFKEGEYDDYEIEDTFDSLFCKGKMNNTLQNDQVEVDKEGKGKKSFEETTLIYSPKGSIEKKTKEKSKSKKNDLKFFICMCGKVYKSKENELLHYKNVHLEQKPYQCSYCNNSISHRNGKSYHERKFHTFIRPYKCVYIKDCM